MALFGGAGGKGVCVGTETGCRSYLYMMPMFPPEHSVAAALREELCYREQQCLAGAKQRR